MDIGVALVVFVLLLLANAFFVGAEFALVSVRRTQLEPRVAAGSRSARLALRGVENVSLMMAGAQLGITACSLGLGAVGEPAVARIIEAPMLAVGLSPELVHPVALVIALVIVVFLHMVLGEMVPKNIALAGPDRAAMVLGPPMYGLVWVLRPVIWLVNQAANLVLRAMQVQPRDEVASAFTRQEVHQFVVESGREGLLDEDELNLLTGALGFDTLTAEDVAIPSGRLRTVPPDVTVAQLEDLCARTGFSRFPVRRDDGRFVGYVHVKDLLDTSAEARDQPPTAQAIHPLTTVRADDLLRAVMTTMQQRSAHMALLEGPGGEDAGIVALEDVLEELVGEVRDATSPPGGVRAR